MTDDLISRQAAIDLFPNDDLEWDTKGGYVAPHLVRRMIEELPSAQPDRKTGRWIEMGQNEDGTHNICCGVCGKFKIKSRGHANSAYTKSKYRFCGGCGAKMGVEHETD